MSRVTVDGYTNFGHRCSLVMTHVFGEYKTYVVNGPRRRSMWGKVMVVDGSIPRDHLYFVDRWHHVIDGNGELDSWEFTYEWLGWLLYWPTRFEVGIYLYHTRYHSTWPRGSIVNWGTWSSREQRHWLTRCLPLGKKGKIDSPEYQVSIRSTTYRTKYLPGYFEFRLPQVTRWHR